MIYQRLNKRPDLVILGGGLTGVITALAIARSGRRVVVVEQDSRLLNRASLRNEGKIHLGFIYANETSMQTASLQLFGALRFWSILSSFLGGKVSEIPLSTPFVYLVAEDSLLTPDQLESHYSKLQDLYLSEISREEGLNYLGLRPDSLYNRSSTTPAWFDNVSLTGVFHTVERAIDTEVMTELLRRRVASEHNIQVAAGVKIEEVARKNGRFAVKGRSVQGAWQMEFDQVVNALWEGRRAIDLSVGLDMKPGWLYRLKYRTIVKLADDIASAASATMVLGRYGDVVIRPNNTAYLSWYPSGLKGWSQELQPPDSWSLHCSGNAIKYDSSEIATETIDAISQWYPAIARSTPLVVDAGVICAFGRTDVDDAQSALHGRSEVGITSDNGYHSVDPGKLTTAPLFGQLAAGKVISH